MCGTDILYSLVIIVGGLADDTDLMFEFGVPIIPGVTNAVLE
jgi:hypothetical protein